MMPGIKYRSRLLTCGYLITMLLFLSTACGEKKEVKYPLVDQADPKAVRVIETAVAHQGGDHLDHHDIQFEFRGRTYKSIRDEGIYQYERIFTDSTGLVRDVLTNDSFTRFVDGEAVELTDERKRAFSNSVNSVIYFALQPYFLQDPAVIARYIDTVMIHGEPYDKIKISFHQEGGGKDFEDEFLYWFHQKNHTMDYLAYNYRTDGGGSRFRAAFNKREIGGIRFADYINYKHPDETLYIMNFDSLYEVGGLDSLSVILTENVMVK